MSFLSFSFSLGKNVQISQDSLLRAIRSPKAYNSDAQQKISAHKWSYSSAFLYSISLITTIGTYFSLFAVPFLCIRSLVRPPIRSPFSVKRARLFSLSFPLSAFCIHNFNQMINRRIELAHEKAYKLTAKFISFFPSPAVFHFSLVCSFAIPIALVQSVDYY